MQNSRAYADFIKQMNATGREKMDGYDSQTLEHIYDWEREEVEGIICNAFTNKNDVELAPFLPKLKKYDGIKALNKSLYLFQIPSYASVIIGQTLYEVTVVEK